MPFITLTSRFTDQPTRVRPDAITAIVNLDEKPGAFVHVGFSGWAVSVTESPETILAAIADAERGGVAVTDEMVDAARDEMARQTLLLDDEPLPDDLWADTPYEDKFKFTTVARMALTAALKARRP